MWFAQNAPRTKIYSRGKTPQHLKGFRSILVRSSAPEKSEERFFTPTALARNPRGRGATPRGRKLFPGGNRHFFFNLLGLGSRLPLAPCRPLLALRCFAACCLSPAACASELRETAAENATSDANRNPTVATRKRQEATKIQQRQSTRAQKASAV